MEKHIYLAACDIEGGVYHCILTEDGRLKIKDFTPMDRPMYLAVEGDRMHVLLRKPWDDSENSGIVTYRIDENGALKDPGALVSTQGVVGCHLSVYENAVYAANYVSGSVIRMPDILVQHHGRSVHPTRQEKEHSHFIHPTPDGKYLLVCDLGMDAVITYDKDLHEISRAQVPAGNGARHIAFSPDGKWVYCACELSSSVSVFAYADGILTFTGDYPALPADFTGESTAAAIRYHDGCVWVSNRGHDSVTVFSADGGKLTLKAYIPSGGKDPRDFDLFGSYMICTNQTSDNVTVTRVTEDGAEQTDVLTGIQCALCVVGI